MKFTDIFFNRFGRLRSGWRFVVFLILFACFSAALLAAAELILAKMAIGLKPDTVLYWLVNTLTAFAAALSVGWFCLRQLENLPFRALGAWFTVNWLKDLATGLLAGAVAVSTAVFIAYIFGGLNFEFDGQYGRSAIWLTLGISLIVFIAGAAFEEILFRGYLFQTFVRADLKWLAIILTALPFALVHLGNPNATYISTLNTALAGVWFGLAYLKTRTLWFVFGLHLAWNWFQGAIFGIEVSGITQFTTAPLLREIDAGPIWLTGEKYGIEGGIVCTLAMLISILLIWFTPVLKPTEEMLALTSAENPSFDNSASRAK